MKDLENDLQQERLHSLHLQMELDHLKSRLHKHPCRECGGQGYFSDNSHGHMPDSIPCASCQGQGYTYR